VQGVQAPRSRCEGGEALSYVVVKWSLPLGIASHYRPPEARLPHCKRKRSYKSVKRRQTPALPRLEEDVTVAQFSDLASDAKFGAEIITIVEAQICREHVAAIRSRPAPEAFPEPADRATVPNRSSNTPPALATSWFD
jgi:hypothetical protein